jgi:carboxymethylenebutenolidase
VLLAVCISAADDKKKESCCATPTEQFAKFGESPVFASAHLAPEPFVYKAEGGVMVMIPAADKKDARIFEVKAAEPSTRYVFMFHEWWGLNDYIQREAEALQKELGSVNVIAIDLYDSKTANDPQTAGKLMGEVKEDRARTIIKAVMDRVGKDAKVATIGWCFGGGWSMQAALMLGMQASGCIIYYGMPEKDVKKIKTLNCDVLGIFGSKDAWISPKVVDEFKMNMESAKKKLEVKMYDADHAFANPSNPKHDKEKAADAHAAALQYLKGKFGL